VRLAYDDSVLRSSVLGKRLNGNKLFAVFTGVVQHISSVLFHQGSQAFSSLQIPARCQFRNLHELLSAGYTLKSKVGDAFSLAESRLVSAAVKECV
jgi:TPP-dependent 2-oxoacid decarboxylase